MTTRIVYKAPALKDHKCKLDKVNDAEGREGYPTGTVVQCDACGAYRKVVKDRISYGPRTTMRKWRRVYPGIFLKRRINRQHDGEWLA